MFQKWYTNMKSRIIDYRNFFKNTQYPEEEFFCPYLNKKKSEMLPFESELS